MKLYVIIADGAFDQVCETARDCDRESRDLRKMGFEVKVRQVSSWAEAEKLEARFR